MLGRSSGNHDWLLANGMRLRFLRFSFTQSTQRKRLRLNGNRALVMTALNALLLYDGFFSVITYNVKCSTKLKAKAKVLPEPQGRR